MSASVFVERGGERVLNRNFYAHQLLVGPRAENTYGPEKLLVTTVWVNSQNDTFPHVAHLL